MVMGDFDWKDFPILDSPELLRKLGPQRFRMFEDGLRRMLIELFEGNEPGEGELTVMTDEWLFYSVYRTDEDDGTVVHANEHVGGNFAGEWVIYDDGRFLDRELHVMLFPDGTSEFLEDSWRKAHGDPPKERS